MDRLEVLALVLDAFGGTIYRNAGTWEWSNDRFGHEINAQTIEVLLHKILQRVRGVVESAT